MRWRVLTQKTGNSQGFTIIEVMIVLAVTGMMFVAVAISISGKQQTTQFQTAMVDARSQIRQVANQVASGFFPGAGSFDCSVSGPVGGQQLNIIAVPATGSSGRCNFIGKALHFYSSGTTGQFSVYSVLGLDGGTTYSSQIPLAINSAPSAPANINLGYGLTANKITYTSPAGATSQVGSFAFMQSLNDTGANSTSSSQHLTILTFDNSSLTNNQTQEANAINTAFHKPGDVGIKPGGTVDICFKSGATNQHGIVTVSSNASNLDISSKIGSGSCP